jgi:hypothetical protein
MGKKIFANGDNGIINLTNRVSGAYSMAIGENVNV